MPVRGDGPPVRRSGQFVRGCCMAALNQDGSHREKRGPMRGGQRKPFRRPSSNRTPCRLARPRRGLWATDPDRVTGRRGSGSVKDVQGGRRRQQCRLGRLLLPSRPRGCHDRRGRCCGQRCSPPPSFQGRRSRRCGAGSMATVRQERLLLHGIRLAHPSTSSSPSTDLRSLATIDGAVTVRVPPSWRRLPASWNLAFVKSPRVGSQESTVNPGSAFEAGSPKRNSSTQSVCGSAPLRPLPRGSTCRGVPR